MSPSTGGRWRWRGAAGGWARWRTGAPHQGGPLGEGSIENGWLRCPWHGYDYDPLTGRPPEGFSDGAAPYEVADRADGVYVRIPAPAPRVRTVADVLVETLVAFGITHVFGMVGHSNLGFADAMRRADRDCELTIYEDEGHRFARPQSLTDFRAKCLAFLLRSLNHALD